MSDTIVIYYSLEGNVDFLAKKIAENLGADTYRSGNSKKCLEIMASEITKKGGTVVACAEFTNPLKKPETALKTIAEFTGKL